MSAAQDGIAAGAEVAVISDDDDEENVEDSDN